MRYRILLLVILASNLLTSTSSAYSTTLAEDHLELTTGSANPGAQQNDYYISPDGVDPSDCSGGTRNNPWKTWIKAEQCVQPGSTVYFTAGDYSRIFSGSSRIEIILAGEAGRPITIKPAPGDEGQVRFAHAVELKGEYGVLSGVEVYANSNYYIAVTVYGDHIVVEENEVHGAWQHGCIRVARGADFISVINNEVYDCGIEPDNIAGTALSTNAEQTVFRGNHIYRARGGIQLKGGATDILVENNRIHSQGDSRSAIFGASMGSLSDPNPEHGNLKLHDPSMPISERYQAKNVTVRNNLIYDTTGYAAISPGGWVDYHIYNNTIFNHSGSVVFYVSSQPWEFFDSTALAYCRSHACGQCTSYSGSKDCVKVYLPSRNGEIKNNIVHIFPSRVMTIEPGNGTGFESASNIYYYPGLSVDTPDKFRLNDVNHSLSEFQSLGYEAGSHTQYPRFRAWDGATLDLRLREGSPAIDTGLPLCEYDFEWTPRPQGAGHDRGAYEFVPDTPTATAIGTPTSLATKTATATSTPLPTNPPTFAPTNTPTPTPTPTRVPWRWCSLGQPCRAVLIICLLAVGGMALLRGSALLEGKTATGQDTPAALAKLTLIYSDDFNDSETGWGEVNVNYPEEGRDL